MSRNTVAEVPAIAMTVFMSFYTMVGGLFVSNLIGTNALSAINLTAPLIQLVTAISTMLATGGSAVIMKKMGNRKGMRQSRNCTFALLFIGFNIFVSRMFTALSNGVISAALKMKLLFYKKMIYLKKHFNKVRGMIWTRKK